MAGEDTEVVGEVRLWVTEINGRKFGANDVVVTLGGTPIEGVAVCCDGEKFVSTQQDCIRWLLERGLTPGEATDLILDARDQEINRKNSEEEDGQEAQAPYVAGDNRAGGS